MPIYQLTPLANNLPQVNAVVERAIDPGARYRLGGNAGWLVSYRGTSVELSKFLGITGQPEGEPPSVYSILITSVGSYYGRGSNEMWEWLKTRMEAG